jgi:hypothetical protein
MLLYHDTNILHVNLTSLALMLNTYLVLSGDSKSSAEVFDAFLSGSCSGIRVMVSRETVPSILRISNRVSSMLMEQRRKLRSRLVTLRPQDGTFQKIANSTSPSSKQILLRHGKLRMTGNTLMVAFFQNGFNDVDWLSLSAERFDVSFTVRRDLVTEATENVRTINSKYYTESLHSFNHLMQS